MKLAVICAMNQNRSMQAHDLFNKKGIRVKSYGTNPVIKLPGESPTSPNVYSFDQGYKEIYDDLCRKNEGYYRESGLLYLLERNMGIKERAENFFTRDEDVDLVITCEEKVFSTILSYYSSVGEKRFFMVNFDIRDTPADAIVGANEIYDFVMAVLGYLEEGMEGAVSRALEEYYEKRDVGLLFTVVNQ
jgi:RNA polymerase II subunit A C-terminal domain phosphatase SSU72